MLKIFEKEETQQQRIEVTRKILRPSKVNLDKIPRWLSKRVTAYINDNHVYCGYTSSVMRLNFVMDDAAHKAGLKKPCGSLIWLDHWGTSKGRYCCCPKNCFVSETYGFGYYAAQIMEAFCKALDLQWHLDANSWHFPGHTLRIIVHPKDHDSN